MKKLLAVLCLIGMIFFLVGCDTSNEQNVETIQDKVANEFIVDMGFVIIEKMGEFGDTCVYLVYDAETKVEYMLTEGYCETSFCPYYDENGEVVIYKGE